MNKIMFAMIIFLMQNQLLLSQQDTIIYDRETGNYIFQYLRLNEETDQRDSLVRITFVPRTKLNPSVKSWVEFIRDSNQYLYNYTIFNGSDSRQKLFIFLIQFGQNVDFKDKSTQKWFGGRYHSAGVPLNKYEWMGNQGLEPTWNKSGFILGSVGLPGIGGAYFQGKVGYPSFPYGMPYEMDSMLIELEKFPNDYVMRATIVPVSTPNPFVAVNFHDTLLSYTRQSVALGWLKSGRDNDCDGDEKPQDGVSKNLEKRLNKVRTELNKGNNLKASKELEKFIKKVERVSKRTDVMTSEAYALLKYNAEYLVSRIITLPTKPAGTVLQQIDELKAELTRQSNKKKIGGALLVKSLSFLADQAKKQLQKPLPSTNDSASAALSIAAFQLFVDEVWELTGALSGKSKKLPALYVYDEAYIQLHYRAKYILEVLPAPRTLIDMKSVEMDDDVRKELDALRQMTKEQ